MPVNYVRLKRQTPQLNVIPYKNGDICLTKEQLKQGVGNRQVSTMTVDREKNMLKFSFYFRRRLVLFMHHLMIRE